MSSNVIAASILLVILGALYAAFMGIRQKGSGLSPSTAAIFIAPITAYVWHGLGRGEPTDRGIATIIGVALLIFIGFALPGSSNDRVASASLWLSLGWAVFGGWLAIPVIWLVNWLGWLGSLIRIPLWTLLVLGVVCFFWGWSRRAKSQAQPAEQAAPTT